MKMNVKLFTRMINMLLGKKIPESKFDFRYISDIGWRRENGCGCTLFHAKKLDVLKCDEQYYCEKLGIPGDKDNGENDYGFLFGFDGDRRLLVFDTLTPSKQEAAQVMEDYLIAVEAGMVEGVET